jgi:hypothetical protein
VASHDRPIEDPEEREFQRLYGPWASSTPRDARLLLDGFPGAWWISGGWAIEAFTGVSRGHKDVDVTIFRRGVAALREHFRGRLDIWAAGSGTLRPLDGARPRPPAWMGQLWLREHALAPWLLDVLLNPGGPRLWVFKRDPSVTRSLDDATWVAPDGLRYLRPELVLAHKAKHPTAESDADLAATLPLLDRAARTWLRAHLASHHPGHPWRTRLEPPRRPRRAGRP